ncbi:general stress protein [Bosea sp. UNC402CLCol]|uniref:general stress protein n=1 Tax=Bosea sp. UNC402CLCol TaxID=1510531 RepID=UPI00056E1AD4|nr:general stress protein [Bosea sp. UNC402CLCol]
MTQTLTRSYENYETARSVVEALEAEGVSAADISVVGHAKADDSNAGEGAGIGAALGGAAGLLAGVGLLAIPGIGPVVAAGWLASTAAGAAAGGVAGGIVGALTSTGHSEEDANYYAETIRRGGSVVSVRVADEQVPAVEAILDGASPIDRDARLAEYRAAGWNRFDETAEPYRSTVI